MLVLSRKVGQRIVLDDDIVITVLQVRGKQVRIGVEAPAAVSIRRDELPPDASLGIENAWPVHASSHCAAAR